MLCCEFRWWVGVRHYHTTPQGHPSPPPISPPAPSTFFSLATSRGRFTPAPEIFHGITFALISYDLLGDFTKFSRSFFTTCCFVDTCLCIFTLLFRSRVLVQHVEIKIKCYQIVDTSWYSSREIK